MSKHRIQFLTIQNFFLGSVVLAGCFTGTAALAQDPESRVLEEITVTAQKREQNLQEVPISITALTGEMMDIRAITNVAQVSEYAPNVYMDSSVGFSGSNSVLAAYIRGIGQSDFAFNLEPGVGVYVDGVYLARTIGHNSDLLDVDRVEILKGPQGTLFGRNTVGGTVNVITRRPSEEFDIRGEVITGEYDRLDVRGAIDIPIADNLLGLVSFSSKDRDGYQERIPYDWSHSATPNPALDTINQFVQSEYDTDEDAGGENQQNLRGKLLWLASDDADVTLAADYSKTDEQGTPNSILAVTPGGGLNGLHDLCVNTPADVLNVIGFGTDFGEFCGPRGITIFPHQGAPFFQQPGIGGVNVDGDPNNNRPIYDQSFILADKDQSYATGNNFNKLDAWGISLTVDWDLANDWRLLYIGSYRDLESAFGFDFDGSPLAVLEPAFLTNQSQYSNEVQLNGLAIDDRWAWLFGVYQFHEDGDLTDYPVIGTGGMLQIYGENYFDNDAWAIFTHNNFALTENWGLTFGLRYTDEKKEFEGLQRDLNNLANKLGAPPFIFPDQNDLTRYYPLGTNKRSFNETDIKAGIEYNFSDDVMAYFSYSEGFKSGGWTTRLSQPQLSVEEGGCVGCVGLEFDPETATTWELGLKSELVENTLQLNVAAFMSTYDDIQVTQQIGASPVFRNGGDADINGFEIETLWLATDNFVFTGSVGFLDAEYTRIEAGVNKPDGTPLTTDDKLVNVPEWDLSLAGDYTIPMESSARVLLHADWSYTTEIANDLGNTPQLMQGNVSLFNAAITYAAPGDHWEIALGARNIFNDRYIVTGQNQPAVGGIYGMWSPPSQWYLTLRFRN